MIRVVTIGIGLVTGCKRNSHSDVVIAPEGQSLQFGGPKRVFRGGTEAQGGTWSMDWRRNRVKPQAAAPTRVTLAGRYTAIMHRYAFTDPTLVNKYHSRQHHRSPQHRSAATVGRSGRFLR